MHEAIPGPKSITAEDYEKLSALSDATTAEREEIMNRYGMTYDSGDIQLEVNGGIITITTDKEDFGTVIGSLAGRRDVGSGESAVDRQKGL